MSKNEKNKDSQDYELFIKLYVANERRIYGYVRALVPNWSDVDDIFQEIATVIWSKFGDFEKGTNFSAWALKVAHFQVLKYCKMRKNDKLCFSEQTIELLAERSSKNNPNIDQRLPMLRKCIRKLQSNELSLIQMRYKPGASTKSVSQQTGKSLHVLYRLFNKIHAKLLMCIRRHLAEAEYL